MHLPAPIFSKSESIRSRQQDRTANFLVCSIIYQPSLHFTHSAYFMMFPSWCRRNSTLPPGDSIPRSLSDLVISSTSDGVWFVRMARFPSIPINLCIFHMAVFLSSDPKHILGRAIFDVRCFRFQHAKQKHRFDMRRK